MSSRLRRATALAAGLASAASMLAVGAGVGSTAEAAPNTFNIPATKNISLLALEYSQQSTLGTVSRYANVITQNWYTNTVSAVHAASTTTRAISYFEASWIKKVACDGPVGTSVSTIDNAHPIDYCWMEANHPEWFLTKADGTRIESDDFPGLWAMDVGSATYRAQWISNAKYILGQKDFDGIFIDDVSLWPAHGTNDGLANDVAKYTDLEYGTAMRDFTIQAGDSLRAAGFYTMANVGSKPWNTTYTNLTIDVAKHLDVTNREFFSRWGAYGTATPGQRWTDPATGTDPALATMRNYNKAIEAAGGHFAGEDYGQNVTNAGDEATMRYGKAQFLLDWNGAAGSTYIFRTNGSGDPARSHWVRDIGTPSGAMWTTAYGAYARSYSKGMVILNQKTTNITAQLPPGTWKDTYDRVFTGTMVINQRDAAILTKIA